MAFIPAHDYRQEQTQRLILKPSLTFKVGDVVAAIGSGSTLYYNELSNETTPVTGAKYPLGVLVGFSKSNGQVISQGQDPINTPNQLTTASDNLTNAQYYGVFLPITSEMEWIGTLSAAPITTVYSNQPYTYLTLSDCRTIDETSAVAADNIQSTNQILSLGVVESGINNPSSLLIYCKIIKNMYNREA